MRPILACLALSCVLSACVTTRPNREEHERPNARHDIYKDYSRLK